jgi:hypothetical protein
VNLYAKQTQHKRNTNAGLLSALRKHLVTEPDVEFVSGCSMDLIALSMQPEVMDLYSIAPLSDLVSQAFRFTMSPGDRVGFIKASDAKPIWHRWSMMQPRFPCYLLLKQLASEGWQRGDISIHLKDKPDEKVYNPSTLAAKKSYLKCCLKLPSLYSKGLGQMLATQHDSFYRCLLASPTPALVLARGKVKDYEKLLAELPINPDDTDIDVAALQRALFDVAEPLPEDRVESNSDAEDDEPLPKDSGCDDETPLVGADANASSSSSSTSSPQGSSEDDQVVGGNFVVPPRYSEGRQLLSDVPLTIDGCRVRQESYLNVRTGIHYTRIGLQCPRHRDKIVNGRHTKCFRWRNCELQQRLGLATLAAPIAFLTLWVREAINCEHMDGHEGHKSFKPNDADVLSLATRAE